MIGNILRIQNPVYVGTVRRMLHHCPSDQFSPASFEQYDPKQFHKSVDSCVQRLYKNTVGCIFVFEDPVERRQNISSRSNSSAGKRRLHRQSGRFAPETRGTKATRDASHAVSRHTRTSANQNAARIQIRVHATRRSIAGTAAGPGVGRILAGYPASRKSAGAEDAAQRSAAISRGG